MQSYLRSLAQVFIHNVGPDLSSYTFIFPNHRAGLFFRKYLAESTSQTIFTPKILTINECFASLTHLCVVDQLTLLLRLYRLYKQHRSDAEPIEEFLHWGKMMLADFSEIDNHLVQDVKSLYALVEDMHDIDAHFSTLTDKQLAAIKRFWGEFHHSVALNNDTHMHTHFIRTWELLYPLYKALQDNLLQDDIAYEGLLHRHVIEHWDEIPQHKFNSNYVFVGFNAMTESERQLMLRIQAMGRADFYFDYQHEFLQDPQNAASRFMQDNLLLFRSKYTIPTPTTDTTHKNINLVTVSSSIAQTHQVHRILSQHISSTDNWTRTAVVLPNEELLIPLLHTIPSHIDKINVTMGYPLRATSAYMLIAYPEQYISPMPTEAIDFIACMRTQLHELYKNSIVYNSQGESISDHSESIYQLYKTLDLIQHTIHQYSDIPFSAISVQQILKMLTLDMTTPYTGEPLEGLQIMGVLETRALDFDNIIITDFNDDIYPGRSRGNSFIPYTLRHGFDLPTIERQDAIFAYNFYRMLSHAKNIWFIANTHADEQHSGELSRYFYQLTWQYQLPITRTTICDELTSNTTERKPILKTEKVQQLLSKYFTSAPEHRYFSASALAEYLRCPKSFYYKYLERVHEPAPDESISISNLTIGIVVHAIMQHLYTKFHQQIVQKSDIESLMNTINDDQYWSSLDALDQLNGDELAKRIVHTCVRNILYHDYNQAPFQYIASEQNVYRNLHLPRTGQDVAFFGTIDRIDIRGNHIRVIDYKTGGTDLKFQSIKKAFGLDDKTDSTDSPIRQKSNQYIIQTLLYCWLLQEHQLIKQLPHTEALSFAPHIYPVRQLHDDNILTYLHQQTEPVLFQDDIVRDFLEELTALLEEIFNPDIPFNTAVDTSRCNECFLNQICSLNNQPK